ncbi:MAG: rhodanese-like domain-containing protein [Crocinitomicaceae bacterium]|nr:rhodanese-like domain-containing protein [Crocinitomicaceae bacterium]
MYCRSGYRSANVCHYLNELGYKNVFNLKGGILNWNNEH